MRSGRTIRTCVFVGILMVVAPFKGPAQDGFKETEKDTYRMYLGKEWDSLITAGHRAIRHGIDYYYLRTRMGIAYGARGRFVQSAWQYDRALSFNRRDPFASGERYKDLVNANRYFQARGLLTTMTREQRELLSEKSPVLNFVSLDMGYTISNAFTKINTSALMGPDSIYGETDLYGDDYFANLALGFNISGRLTLIAGYTYLNFAKRKIIEYSYYEDQLDSTSYFEWGYENHYSFPRVNQNYSIDYFIDQHEYSLGGVIALDHGVNIMPLFRLISTQYTNTGVQYSSALVNDTSYYVNASGIYYTFPFTRTHYSVTPVEMSTYNYLFSLAGTRDFDFLTIGMSGSWSDLNGSGQIQVSGTVTWYPLGNLNLYGTTGATVLSEEGDGRVLLSQTAGGKVTRWLWAEGDFTWGDLSNGNTSNGWVVYNNTGRIRYRAGASLILTLVRDIQFTFNYQFFEKESPLYQYELPEKPASEPVVVNTHWQSYQTHTMFLGIRIRI